MLYLARGSRLLAKLVSDFVSELLNLALLELDALALEIFHDILACAFAFFRGEKETNCGTCDSATYDCEYDV